jgi:hypothetical protein
MEFYRGQQNGMAVSRRTVTTYWVCLLLGIAVNGGVIVCAQDVTGSGQTVGLEVLEDFQNPDAKGFPQGWEGQRSTVTAHEAYTIQQEEGISFLSAKSANQRVYTKQIKWDPKKFPVLTWRWRIKSVPDNPEFIAAIYPSLDVDLLFIPVNTKYLWSATLPVGTVKEGGMFSSTEIVIRSGTQPVGEWIEERVNVYEDFLEIHNHEPAAHAWGISLLGGPGVEVDFGLIRAQAE